MIPMFRSKIVSVSLAASLALAVLPLARAEEKPSVPPASPSTGMAMARALNEAYVSVFERVAPAVVVIEVSKKPSRGNGSNPMDFFQDFFHGPNGPNSGDDESTPSPRNRRTTPRTAPTPRPEQSEGSGFIVRADGFIYTNNHVVEGGDKISVRLKDGRVFTATMVGADEKTDIAVIKIDATGLPTIALGDSDALRVGEIVFAIGAPFQLAYTFTSGVVSAKGRNQLGMTRGGYEDYIQTDASINPGNSGGPLVNLDGQVIGMNTLINGLNRGLGFAIPAAMLRDVGGQLLETGRVVRPYLGIRIESLEDYLKQSDSLKIDGVKSGVIVRSIDPDTPAYKSELRPADVITEVDGKEVRTSQDLQKAILGKKVGAKVTLSVVRKGKPMQITVTTAELPGSERPVRASNPNPKEKKKVPGEEEKASYYGLEIQALTPEVAATMGLKEEKGVVVTNVDDGSPAAGAQLRVKDVITEVGDKPVTDVASFKEAMKGSDLKRGVLLYVARGGKTDGGKTFVVIKESER